MVEKASYRSIATSVDFIKHCEMSVQASFNADELALNDVVSDLS